MALAEKDRLMPAEHCQTMAAVRAGIDAIDCEIVALLAARTQYIAAAARIKSSRNAVHDQARINDVLEKTARCAAQNDVPVAIVEATFRALMDASIAHEFALFDARA